MSCREIRMEIPCTKRAWEAERHSEFRKTEPIAHNEALRWLDKSCGDGRFDIAALRSRIRPGGEQRAAAPGNTVRVFSNRPNRDSAGKHRNGGRRNRSRERHGETPRRSRPVP